MAIISENISGVLIQVPDDLPAPKTRKAIEHAVAAKRAREKAFAARDNAADLRWRVDEQVAREHGALLDEDPDVELPDGGAIVADVQSLLDERQRDLNARIEAERRGAVKIRDAVADELPLLARASLAEGDTALAMLAAALEDAITARDALHSSIGVGRMAARLAIEPGAPVAIQHKAYGYTFDLEAAIEGLSESLAKADAELRELRDAEKPATAKKTRKPRKAASEAPVAAEAASVPVAESAAPEAIAFEVGEDEDDE